MNKGEFGEPVIQPSPMDGGSMPDDKTGELRGYVTVEDGALVDVAARSVDPEQESPEYYKLDDSWPTSVRREDYRSLKGQTVTKSGRTTGVTQGDVKATGASVRVNYGEAGTITLRDQLIAGPMSKGGDSGSPVFLDSTGELVGLLFAGSARQTIFSKIAAVESELGVELLTEEPGEGGSGGGDGGSGGDGGRGGDGGSGGGQRRRVGHLPRDVRHHGHGFDRRPGTVLGVVLGVRRDRVRQADEGDRRGVRHRRRDRMALRAGESNHVRVDRRPRP